MLVQNKNNRVAIATQLFLSFVHYKITAVSTTVNSIRFKLSKPPRVLSYTSLAMSWSTAVAKVAVGMSVLGLDIRNVRREPELVLSTRVLFIFLSLQVHCKGQAGGAVAVVVDGFNGIDKIGRGLRGHIMGNAKYRAYAFLFIGNTHGGRHGV